MGIVRIDQPADLSWLQADLTDALSRALVDYPDNEAVLELRILCDGPDFSRGRSYSLSTEEELPAPLAEFFRGRYPPSLSNGRASPVLHGSDERDPNPEERVSGCQKPIGDEAMPLAEPMSQVSCPDGVLGEVKS